MIKSLFELTANPLMDLRCIVKIATDVTSKTADGIALKFPMNVPVYA